MKVNNEAAHLLCFIVVGIVCINVRSWPCESTGESFTRSDGVGTLSFNILQELSIAGLVKVINVLNFNNSVVARVVYQGTTVATTDVVPGFEVTGNSSGQVVLKIQPPQAVKKGTYWIDLFENDKCICLFVLGIPTTPSISKDKDPSVGESVSLTCSSTSTTTPSNHSLSLVYNWIVDGVDDPSGSRYTYSASRHTFTLSSVVKDDASKNFTCTSKENVTDGYTSSRSNVASLSVFYGPENMAFSPPNTTYTAEENTELPQITCSAVCNPVCSFQWSQPATGLQVSSSHVLRLGILKASKAGNYRCTATRSGSFTNSKDLTVNVIYGPYPESIALSPTQTAYTVNENDVLPDITCRADCYPDCSYTWSRHRDGLTSVVSRTAVLVLKTVNRTDAATYVCSAVNEQKRVNNSTQKEVQVKVNYGPDGACDNVSSLQTFTEGDSSVNIRCFSECYPGCSYTWSNGSGVISASEALSLGIVRRYQAGNYTLSVRNTAQTYSRSAQKIFTVVVKYAPVVSVDFSTTNHSEGASLTLFCRGEGVPSSYIYSGLTQSVDEVRVPNTAIETYSFIHFSKLQLQDTGNYTCTMNNGIRDLNGILDQTGTVQLLVEVQPKILDDDLKFAGAENKAITVRVPFYCFPAVQYVTFAKYDGTAIRNSTKYWTSFMPGKVNDKFHGKEVTLNGYIAVLTINDLEEEDFVNYTLTVHNRRGTTLELIFIVAESIPSSPKGFFLSSTGLHFIWEKGFNGGHPQTFIIQVSADGKAEWQNLSSIHENNASYQVNSTFYSVEIEGLHPGTYTARLIATNSLGETTPLYLNASFTVVSDKNSSEHPLPVVAGAVGGSLSAIVVIVVVVVVVVWRRRVGHNASGTEQETHKKQNNFSENSYYNLQSLQEGQSTYCDLLKTDTNERSAYSDLHLYERSTEVSAYGKLKGADERDRNRTYASLCPETGESSTSKGHDKTYVNLVVKK